MSTRVSHLGCHCPDSLFVVGQGACGLNDSMWELNAQVLREQIVDRCHALTNDLPYVSDTLARLIELMVRGEKLVHMVLSCKGVSDVQMTDALSHVVYMEALLTQ